MIKNHFRYHRPRRIKVIVTCVTVYVKKEHIDDLFMDLRLFWALFLISLTGLFAEH